MTSGAGDELVGELSNVPDAARPMPPALPGTVATRTQAEDLFESLASDLLSHAFNCVREFGDFHLALSGGQTPFPLYRLLMIDPRWRGFPWRRTHLWVVDERRVPFTAPQSNWRQIEELIVEHADIPREQTHPIEATEPDAAVRYEAKLRETLAWREKGHDRLDFVLLGMGDNGHTASLFPHTAVLHERERLVADCDGPTVTPPPRVTMTYPLINGARFIAVLVAGAAKASMLKRVAAGKDTFEDLPIMGIKPVGGELRWYLDGPACGNA